jgi:lipopolysaccharide export system ATP-binding protein
LVQLSLVIQTKGLVKRYGSRTVVNDVSFNVKQGEIVGLLGPNGAGKTTSFYQVVGLVKPDEGRVFLNDLDITKMPMYKRAKMGIGYLPQEASVFRKLTVEDNIKAVLEMTKLTKQEQKDKLETLLDEFHLQHVRKGNGDTLSGGERRRTEIARSLAVDPKFILLDEPFAGVDPIAVEDIQGIVAKLKFRNIGVLITDHNVNETLSICDRAYLLIDGKIFRHGTAEELADDEQVRRLYLGRNFELKRKDYLHDQAKATDNTPSIKNIIRTLEGNVVEIENIEKEENANSHSFQLGYIPKNITEYESFKNFKTSFAENFSFLEDYADKNNIPEIKEKVQVLQSFNGNLDNLKADINSILFYLKAADNY